MPQTNAGLRKCSRPAPGILCSAHRLTICLMRSQYRVYVKYFWYRPILYSGLGSRLVRCTTSQCPHSDSLPQVLILSHSRTPIGLSSLIITRLIDARRIRSHGARQGRERTPGLGAMSGEVHRTNIDRVAILEIDNPPVNAMSQRIRRALADHVARADSEPQQNPHRFVLANHHKIDRRAPNPEPWCKAGS
jgi:hypothetical protein